MITRVRVKNFRSLADVDVTLGPLTVLVGRNGAGKSAFIDALRFVRDVLRSGVDEAIRKRNGLPMLQTRKADGSIKDMAFEICVQSERCAGQYGFALGSEEGKYVIRHEFCRLGSTPDTLKTVFDMEAGQWAVAPALNSLLDNHAPDTSKLPIETTGGLRNTGAASLLLYSPAALILPLLGARHGNTNIDVLYSELTAANYYAIYPNSLRVPQPSTNVYALSENADNLTSALKRILDNNGASNVLAAMKFFVEDVEDIKVDELGSYRTIQIKHGFKERAGFWLDLAQESDGTVRFLAMLTALYQDAEHALISIEEPELFLYPRYYRLIHNLLAETALQQQIVITTQSPDLISEFDVEELRIVERKEGETYIGPLLPEQVDAVHKELFTTGDLLRIEGLRATPFEAVSAEYA